MSHRKVFPKCCHLWLRGRCLLVQAFYSPQWHAGASWRAADGQSSVELALRVGGGSGGTRLWWMMLRSFQILTWETGPHCELSGKTPHKSMSIWSINIAAKGYLCITGFVAGYEHVQIDSSAWIPSLSVEVTSHKWLKIYRRKIKIVKKNQPHEQLSEAVLGHSGALN